jgi:hypothetical protein
MISIGDNKYKLVLIDTCIISELLKNKKELSKNIFSKLLDSRIACFTIETIEELKMAPKVFDEFIEKFCAVVPALLLKSWEILIEEERKNYNTQGKIDPVQISLNYPFIKGSGFSVKAFLNSYFTREYLEKQREIQKMSLESMLKLRDQYPPDNSKYTLDEINEFVELVTYKQLILRYRIWCQEMLDEKKSIDAEKFPSIQMLGFLAFYKFYINNRKPKLSDIPDLLMSSAYPYIDELITEKNQAEMIRQIQIKHHFCNQLTIYTINNFI